MPRGTTLRNIRVSEELWAASREAARRRGTSVSEMVRELLEAYVDTPDEVLSSLRGTAENRAVSMPNVIATALGVYELRHGSRFHP